MMESNRKSYRGSQEPSSYGDTSFSRHSKYTMYSFPKGNFRTILKVLAFIIAFLIFAALFILVGLFLYPELVADCKKLNSEKQYKNEEYYVSSFSELLKSVGLCKESHYSSLSDAIRLGINETEKTLKKTENKPLNNTECICSNSSKSLHNFTNGNESHHILSDGFVGENCICNKTLAKDDLLIMKAETGSEYHHVKLPSITRAFSNDHLVIKARNGSEYHDTKFTNITETFHNDHLTIKAKNGDHLVIKARNGSEYYKSKLPNITQTFNIGNFSLNNTVSGSKNDTLNASVCKCPKDLKIYDVNLNKTKSSNVAETTDIDFEENDNCKCPELFEFDNLDDKEKMSEIELNNIKSPPKASKCICPNVNFKHENEELTSKMREDVECICPEVIQLDNSNTNKTMNQSDKYKNYLPIKENLFNKSSSYTNKTEIRPVNADKCVCPKTYDMGNVTFNESRKTNEMQDSEFFKNDECKCPDILEIDNFDVKENGVTEKNDVISIKTEYCECPRISEVNDGIVNGTKIKSEVISGKMVGGECICPKTTDIDNLHFNETKPIAKEIFKSDNSY